MTIRLLFSTVAHTAVTAVPEAWVVRCVGCHCTITAFATDPQAEHLSSHQPSPPYKGAVQITCSCCWSVYRYLEDAIFRGQPQQSEQCRRKSNGAARRPENNDGKLMFLGACLIAAVRLAREENFGNNPRVNAKIGDSVQLAQRVFERDKRELPQAFQNAEGM